ncbi:unnamed protein product [Tenebrio molitor]|nr:unnamed protein product [Tenebrio molitor]
MTRQTAKEQNTLHISRKSGVKHEIQRKISSVLKMFSMRIRSLFFFKILPGSLLNRLMRQ